MIQEALNNDAAMSRFKARNDVRGTEYKRVSGLIQQLQLEKAVKKELNEIPGDHGHLLTDVLGLIRDYTDEELNEVYKAYTKHDDVLVAITQFSGNRCRKKPIEGLKKLMEK